ncbi:MAG: FecR domain-containing protein [Pseudomonadales bacterium]|jgi:hypothetical protein
MWIRQTFIRLNSASLKLCFWLIAITSLAACQAELRPAANPPVVIGSVTHSSGYPEVIRKNRTYILAAQSKIYADDVLNTDEKSKVLITMKDGTTFRLGPDTHFVLHRYQITANNTVAANMTITSGSLQANLAATGDNKLPGNFELRTPLATVVGSSGEFWGGFSFTDNTLDIALFSGEAMSIRNQHGETKLHSDAWGTSVIGDSAPQPARAWSNQKLAQALAETQI